MRLILMVLLLATLASTAASRPAPPAPSPLIGHWAVDLSRLPVPPEARPKSVSIAFGWTAKGDWTTVVDITGGDGSARHMISSAPTDGTAVAIDGDRLEADSVAVRLAASNVLVLALAKDGMPASTRIYMVAPDGATMTETSSTVGPDGKPALRMNFLTRVK